ncbi:ABC transporter ATP-binding protein [Nocardioides sp. Iso805N]|uniref:ABC transporter ATP-binding protein n=1 Tax=Nocardioides sp. Iso805N TaxID=1283287 RepID=UPI000562691F|nr:ABC transporter ATP-binding protein [Nocardioides sp. Iso805N]
MSAPALRARIEAAGYGRLMVLRDVEIHVSEGEVVALLGANGAGKTTLLRAISGLVRMRGTVDLGSASVTPKSPERMARLGVGHVPQGRGTFPNLTVHENLVAGAAARRGRLDLKADIERWTTVFPRLAERMQQNAGQLSGGEQQMLAVARALMGRPRVLLLDEPSLGLAPAVVHELFDKLAELNRDLGTAMLVVEQNATAALRVAHRGVVLEAGRVALAGAADELRDDQRVRQAYLGL